MLRCSEANAFATSNAGIVLREAEIQRQRSAARQLLSYPPRAARECAQRELGWPRVR